MAAKVTKVELYKGGGKKPYRWRAVARNGEIISQGQGYTKRSSAKRGAQRAHPGAVLVSR